MLVSYLEHSKHNVLAKAERHPLYKGIQKPDSLEH
jgi:hypothetical protein